MTGAAVPSRIVLRDIEAEGRPHLGPVSEAHGFMPAEPPDLALPAAFAAWDEAAAALPSLWRDTAVRPAIERDLPALDATELPDASLRRAAVVLGALAYSYVRCHLDHLHEPAPIAVPEHLAGPWRDVSRRIGREAPFFAYDDLVTHNWRLLDPGAPPVLENLRLLVPLLDNMSERSFVGGNIEIAWRLGPVVGACVRGQQSVAAGDRGGLVAALLDILAAVRDATDLAFSKIDPNPHAAFHADPVVWAKLVAPTGSPIVTDGPGISGLGAAGFQLVDAFLGRRGFASPLGVEATHNLRFFAPNVRRFLEAVGEVSVRDHVQASGDRELAGLFESVLDSYAGERGYLGVHRRKVYGFIETAFKIGRPATASGITGDYADRTWRETDEQLSLARDERYLEMSDHAHRANVAAREPVAGGGRVQRVTLDVRGAGLVLRPGDRCQVLPEHTDALVERTLRAMDGRASHPVPLSRAWRVALQRRDGGVAPPELPLGDVLRLARLRPLDRRIAKRLVALSGSAALGEIVEARAEDRHELWDAIEMAKAAGYDPARMWRADLWQDEALTRVVPPERPRMYSVSAPPAGAPFADEIGLTVGRLCFESAGEARHGTGSTFLAEAAPEGHPVPVRVVRPLRFALPQDPAQPIVLFAGGTGIAPFRGFILERIADPRSGPTWLFAAARTREDLPYLEELLPLAREGRVRLVTAFSRQEDAGVAPRRIADVIASAECADELRDLLEDGRSCFYVCGQAAFARSVLDALDRLGPRDVPVVRRLVGEGRLLTDLFTTFAPRAAGGVLGDETLDVSDLVLRNDDDHGWWMAIAGIAYDVTEFRRTHPGGTRIIDHNAGVDCTSEYRAVLHHEDSEIEALLAMYKAGSMRRLDFGGAWGVAIAGGRLRHVPVVDAYRGWVRQLYVVVEQQNALRNDADVLRLPLTSADPAHAPTRLHMLLAGDLAGRLVDVYLRNATGPALTELWEVAAGLFDAETDVTELPRAIAALDTVSAGRSIEAFREAVREGTADPADLQPVAAELVAAAEEVLAGVKAALREGLLPFERHEGAVLAHGAPVLAALRTIPPVIGGFLHRVTKAASVLPPPGGKPDGGHAVAALP